MIRIIKSLTDAEIVKRLEFHEGLRLHPYRCSKGKLTIGIGRCLDTNPLTSEEKRVIGDWQHGITRESAFYLLRNDINRCEKECRNKILFYDKLDCERKYALLDMCFQLGINGLLGFRKMLSSLAIGNYQNAAMHCLDSKYAKQDTPTRAKRIAKLIETGRWEQWIG